MRLFRQYFKIWQLLKEATQQDIEGVICQYPKEARIFYIRASERYKAALSYSVIIIFLFVSAFFVTILADYITELMIDASRETAVRNVAENIRKIVESPEEVRLWKGFDFESVATTHENDIAVVSGAEGFIIISDNDRRSWRKIPIDTTINISEISLNGNGEIGVAVGEKGLFLLSSDYGETWKHNNIMKKDINRVALSNDGSVIVTVFDRNLVQVSIDGGKSWSSPVKTKENINDIALSRGRDTNTAILVGGNGLINYSTDRGMSWKPSNYMKDDLSKIQRNFMAVAVSDDGKTAIAVGEKGLVYHSIDGGKNWEIIKNKIGVDLKAVTLSSNGSTAVAVGEDGIILVSTDGGKKWDDERFKDHESERPSNYLNAVALERGAKTALIVGDNTTILRLTIPNQKEFSASAHIEPIYEFQITRNLSEEEKERKKERIIREGEAIEKRRKITEEEKKRRNERERIYNVLEDKVFVRASILRIGSILLFLLWIRHTAGLVSYNLRLAAYYYARADAIRLVGWEEAPQPNKMADLVQMIREVSPDDIDTRRY